MEKSGLPSSSIVTGVPSVSHPSNTQVAVRSHYPTESGLAETPGRENRDFCRVRSGDVSVGRVRIRIVLPLQQQVL